MVELMRRFGVGLARFYAIALCLSLSLTAGAVGTALVFAPTAAFADDGDGDSDGDSDSDSDSDSDDGDDDDSDDSDHYGGRASRDGGRASDGGRAFNIFRQRRAAPEPSDEPARPRRPRRAQAAPRAPAVELPTRAPAEIIALGLTTPELDQLLAAGYGVVQQQDIDAAAATLLRLSVPAGTSLEDARDTVRAINPEAVADFNHFYRPVSTLADERCDGLSCGSAVQIGWPVDPGTRGQCTTGATIGIVDTGINVDHAALVGADLTVLPFDIGEPDVRGSSATHGTAVAALLLSGDESRAPGLVPDAKVYAVDAFIRATAGGSVVDERTDAFTLVRAMDLIAERPITVLNLSLAGPPNTTLEAMVDRLAAEDIVMVASVGNAGPRAGALYPAAYPSVIGVTAVDHTNRIFRRATRGEHVDFAAPGVEVWTAASVRGVKPRTGTSFATPFVTAVVALLQAQNEGLGEAGIREALTSAAIDLGAAGRDEVFGHGLVQAPLPCTPLDGQISEVSDGPEALLIQDGVTALEPAQAEPAVINRQ